MVSETKLDDTFPTTQFLIEGFSDPLRLDRNRHGGGILFYTRDDLPCKELKSHQLPSDVEAIFLEIIVMLICQIAKKKRYLFKEYCDAYMPNSQKKRYFFGI